MSDLTRLATVILTILFLIEGITSKKQDQVIDDIKSLVKRVQSIANSVINENKKQQIYKTIKQKDGHFGTLNDKFTDEPVTQNEEVRIEEKNKSDEVYIKKISDVLGKKNDIELPHGPHSDDGSENEKSDNKVVGAGFLKELNLQLSSVFKGAHDDIKKYQQDPSYENGDDENDAYWVDKENPQNYRQEGLTVLEQLMEQQIGHQKHHEHNIKKTFVKPNDLTGYEGLFDLQNRAHESQSKHSEGASKNYKIVQDDSNLQPFDFEKITSDFRSQKHSDIRSLSDGSKFDKYSRVYVILNPQALKKPKPKSETISALLTKVLYNLLQNDDQAQEEKKYKGFLFNQNRRKQRGSRALVMEHIDLSSSDDDSGSIEAKPKRAPPNRPKPMKLGSGGGGGVSRPKGRPIGSDSDSRPVSGLGLGGGKRGVKGKQGGLPKGGFGKESRGASSFAEEVKGPKEKGGKNAGAGRNGAGGHTSIPYIGGGRYVYE